MSKSFRRAAGERTSPSSPPHLTTTDWKLCLICQEKKTETLTKPDQSKRKDIGSGYSSLAENLVKFSELGELPRSFHLEDSMMVMALELLWLHTVQSIIRHADSSTTTLNCREHNREHSIKKVRVMKDRLNTNAPGYIHSHRVQRRRSQKLVSSVHNLVGLTVFGKLQHSNWTDGCVSVQPFLVMQNY